MNNKDIKRDICTFLIVPLILLIEYRFFFLIKIPDIVQKAMTYHNKLLVFIIVLLFFALYTKVDRTYKFIWEILGFIILIVISMLAAYIRYQPTLKELLIPSVAYLSIILYIPLRRVLANNMSLFITFLTYLNIIACIILLLQVIVFSFNENIFLSIYEFYRSGRIATRDGNLRITYLGTVISLSCIISVGVLINNNRQININPILHSINIILSLVYFQVVSQTRMYVLSIILTIVIQIFFVLPSTKNKWLYRILFVFSGLILGYFVGAFGYIKQFIEPLLDGSYLNDGSYYARLDSIEHFTNVIKEHPILGNTVLDPSTDSSYYYQIRGPKGQSYYSDVGILGVAAQFGIPMLVWYLVLLYKIIALRLKTNDLLVNSLFIFILITSLTLIVLDPQRIIFLAFSLAIIDTLCSQSTESFESIENRTCVKNFFKVK